MTRLTDIALPLDRLVAALERLASAPPPPPDFDAADAFLWDASLATARPVDKVNRIDLRLLVGVDDARDTLLANTRRFASGLPANNALLWGARGAGKSSLVKAVHAAVVAEIAPRLKLIEMRREDLAALPGLLRSLREAPHRFVLFVDDLTFDAGDGSYRALKTALEGGIEGRPPNVVLYATSNRRHLRPRDMVENEAAGAIFPGEAVEEAVSLSDRFGLWLGFHAAGQDDYLAMVRGYAAFLGIAIADEDLVAQALEWAAGRGARSGRVAWQFTIDLAGRSGIDLAGR